MRRSHASLAAIKDMYAKSSSSIASVGAFFSALPEPLIRASDTGDALWQNLVERAMVVVPLGEPPLPEDARVNEYDTNHGFFVRFLVAHLLSRSGGGGGNTLCRGARLVGGGNVECATPNSALQLVCTRTWQKLHERVGSDLFRHLLLHTSVFVELDNGIFFQVCGRSFRRAAAALPRTLVPVRRARLFYNDRFVKRAGFTPDHVLSTTEPSKRGGRMLAKHIFRGSAAATWRVPRPLRPVVAPLTQLLRNHEKLRYGFWLRKHCALELVDASAASYTPHRNVSKFVMACIRRLIPAALWGSPDNAQLTARMVDELVGGRRYDEFNVDTWANLWRTRPCAWLPVPSAHAVRVWLRWIVNELVMPLLYNHFYATESAAYHNKVFYFRKPLWRKLVAAEQGVNGMYRRITSTDQPVTTLRLQPKASGMRPLLNLSSGSINQKLRPAFEALRWELLQGGGKQYMLGASVFSLHDAYAKMLPLILWRRANPSVPLFVVSVDVKKSFDSINQAKLCSILFDDDEPVFSHDTYCTQRYVAYGTRAASTHAFGSVRQAVTPLSQLQPLHATVSGRPGTVVTDYASMAVTSRTDIETMIRNHLTHNTVRIGDALYEQDVGIPQGSVMSSLLCSLFYGHMERHGLADLVTETGTLLMRYIDDSVFFTTDEARAAEFLRRMSRDFVRDYGTELNERKTLCSWPSAQCTSRIPSDPAFPSANPCLAWCGVLIDTVTLEVFGDYTRYRGTYMVDSLSNLPGGAASLAEKIKQFVQPKCIALLLDARINRPSVVQLNIYQIMLVSAMKFHAHVMKLQHHDNQLFLGRVVAEVVDYSHELVGARCPGHVSSVVVIYLARHAFWRVLQRKQIVYAEVLRVLQEQLAEPRYGRVAKELADVVDLRRTSLFWAGMIF